MVEVGEVVDQVGGGRHARMLCHLAEQAKCLLGAASDPKDVAGKPRDGKHRRELLQFTGRLPALRATVESHDAFDVGVACDLGLRQRRRVDVHQVLAGMQDDDGARGRNAVEVMHRHAFGAEEDRIETPCKQRCSGVGHGAFDGAEPLDHRFEVDTAGPHLAVRCGARMETDEREFPEAASHEVRVTFDQAGHQYIVGKACIERERTPRLHPRQVTDRQHPAITHGDVRCLGLYRVHGEDLARLENGDVVH